MTPSEKAGLETLQDLFEKDERALRIVKSKITMEMTLDRVEELRMLIDGILETRPAAIRFLQRVLFVNPLDRGFEA